MASRIRPPVPRWFPRYGGPFGPLFLFVLEPL